MIVSHTRKRIKRKTLTKSKTITKQNIKISPNGSTIIEREDTKHEDSLQLEIEEKLSQSMAKYEIDLTNKIYEQGFASTSLSACIAEIKHDSLARLGGLYKYLNCYYDDAIYYYRREWKQLQIALATYFPMEKCNTLSIEEGLGIIKERCKFITKTYPHLSKVYNNYYTIMRKCMQSYDNEKKKHYEYMVGKYAGRWNDIKDRTDINTTYRRLYNDKKAAICQFLTKKGIFTHHTVYKKFYQKYMTMISPDEIIQCRSNIQKMDRKRIGKACFLGFSLNDIVDLYPDYVPTVINKLKLIEDFEKHDFNKLEQLVSTIYWLNANTSMTTTAPYLFFDKIQQIHESTRTSNLHITYFDKYPDEWINYDYSLGDAMWFTWAKVRFKYKRPAKKPIQNTMEIPIRYISKYFPGVTLDHPDVKRCIKKIVHDDLTPLPYEAVYKLFDEISIPKRICYHDAYKWIPGAIKKIT